MQKQNFSDFERKNRGYKKQKKNNWNDKGWNETEEDLKFDRSNKRRHNNLKRLWETDPDNEEFETK